MPHLPTAKAILFDWDNTLVETWPVIHAAMNGTLVEFGRQPWTLEETKTRVRKSMRDAFPELFGDAWEAAGEAFYRHYSRIHLEELIVLKDADLLLRSIQAAGVPMGVVSNKNGGFLRKEANHLNWTPYFSKLVGATDAENDKPALDPVMLALEPMGLSPSTDIWFVGDADIDLACARNAGLTGILVRPEAPTTDEFDGHSPDRYCPNLSALLAAFNEG